MDQVVRFSHRIRPHPCQPLAAGAALSNVLFGVNRAMLPRAPWPKISWWGIRKSEGPILYWVSSRYQTGGGEFQEATNPHEKVRIRYLAKLIVNGLGVVRGSTAIHHGCVVLRRCVNQATADSPANLFQSPQFQDENARTSQGLHTKVSPGHSRTSHLYFAARSFILLPSIFGAYLRKAGVSDAITPPNKGLVQLFCPCSNRTPPQDPPAKRSKQRPIPQN